LFIGQVEKGNRVRKLAAPLCFCPVDLLNDDESPTVTHNIRWESVTLNYDLIALVLGDEADEEAEDLPFRLPQTSRQIPPPKLRVFTDMESKFDRQIDDAKFQNDLLRGSELHSLMVKIKSELSEFGATRISNDLFDIRKLGEFIGPQDLLNQAAKFTFFPHRFLFVAPVAEQLATYIALRELIRQTEEHGV
jgi:hypothetical protein